MDLQYHPKRKEDVFEARPQHLFDNSHVNRLGSHHRHHHHPSVQVLVTKVNINIIFFHPIRCMKNQNHLFLLLLQAMSQSMLRYAVLDQAVFGVLSSTLENIHKTTTIIIIHLLYQGTYHGGSTSLIAMLCNKRISQSMISMQMITSNKH